MRLGMVVGLSSGHIVLGGDPAGWIKMTLGTQVGLGQGHIVLDKDPEGNFKDHYGEAVKRQCLDTIAETSDFSVSDEML